MIDSVFYIPGSVPAHTAPLSRFLPPFADGIVKEWLDSHIPRGAWVLDPFGASPRQTVEAARAGYRILTAAANPILKFLIEVYANPPNSQTLRTALAELAFDPRSGERLELQIRSFYQTQCETCNMTIDAQAYIWERDSGMLVGRIYSCPHCRDSGEHPATPADIEQAHLSSASALHRSRALERVASLHDPDRVFVEEALEVYPARAINALLKLVNRIERMTEERRLHASILLLAAFDQANGLWHYPVVRSRPRQLSLSTRYLEKNIWLALEECALSWPKSLEEAAGGDSAVEYSTWPDIPSGRQGICIFAGHLKDLASLIDSSSTSAMDIQGIVGALPRYNQAFWTLSALWAGWLWGKSSIADFRSVLRRRRYDWGWHLMALHTSLANLTPNLRPGIPGLGLIGEAEPNFVSTALLSAELTGLNLGGIAVRSNQEQVQIHWKNAAGTTRQSIGETDPTSIVKKGIMNYLSQRGEPASYLRVHTSAVQAYIEAGLCASDRLNTPLDTLHQVDQAIEQALRMGAVFTQFSTSGRIVDAGRWWLNDRAAESLKLQPPLSDRAEIAVLRILQEKNHVSLTEVDAAVCRELRGLFTPDLELINECVRSYGVELNPGSGIWHLRPQDEPAIRRIDIMNISESINLVGEKLGYRVSSGVYSTDQTVHPFIRWHAPVGEQSFVYYLTATGVLGEILFHPKSPGDLPIGNAKQIIVLPGGRAGLVEWKIQKDPLLRREINLGWTFTKFRHIRWMAENESLNQANIQEILNLDPLSNKDPQMPLL